MISVQETGSEQQVIKVEPVTPVKKNTQKISLECKENIDWKELKAREPIPGVYKAASKVNSFPDSLRLPSYANLEIESRDVKSINEMGRYSPVKMDDCIRQLMEDAYVLRLQEEKEYQIGRLLNLFPEQAKTD